MKRVQRKETEMQNPPVPLPESDERVAAEAWFVERFLRNIMVTSATARGQQLSRGRTGKVQLDLFGAALTNRVTTNSRRVAAVILLAVERGWLCRHMLREITKATHQDFPADAGSYRTHPTKQRWGVNPREISRRMKRFRGQVDRRLKLVATAEDAEELAAWIEFQLDEVIHPFGDGCGRVSKAMGAWVLARRGLPPPDYGSREEYHAAMRQGFGGFLTYYRRACREHRASEQPVMRKLTDAHEEEERRPPLRAPRRAAGESRNGSVAA